ncbi:chemotaxis protein [Herbaspirillum rubrisubalbicans]|uniref:Chemotaxis protein n=1 Tax=Herbaspirillum rubrisubalbicans TaxID=80842 RepID=A0ABX9BY81_9BURK|nr:methyl-accepting chemotaxis protein [Herbaspirillum rubrisubalbicans]MCP1575409.1 methyl-accepting chemotaxis protein [Herbaspirillum rubrisubalbicans]RAM62933.1 chemotaxis protein [Herbaspirillum rubrisubalbicans]RAN46701.1 chemotaxis protein [Herbaspirillum rubrisubalbicans]
MFGSLTVGRKLGLAFLCMVVVSLAGSALSLFNFNKLEAASAMNVHTYEVMGTADDMLVNMINIETGIRGYVASGNEAFLGPYLEGRKEFRKAFDEAKKLTSDNPAQQKRLAEILELTNKIEEVDQVLIKLRKEANASGSTQALQAYFGAAHDKVHMDRFRAVEAEFNQAEESLLKVRSEQVRALSSSTLSVLIGAGALTVLLAIIAGFAITRSIVNALGGEPAAAAQVAHHIASGDLTVPVPLKNNDRDSLMASLATMREQLTTIVRGIQSSGESISVAAGEIATGNTDLSQRTEQQAASLEETASSMEELTSTVRQNSDNARQGNVLAENASTLAVKGGEVVGRVIDTMNEISDSSNKVSDIITVIEGIAFQTNILALNAAVEAARAGEQGRGFAVVASEVRSLAQRSAAAAKDVKDLISLSGERVQRGTHLVSEAGQTINEVVQAVRNVTDIMTEISAASSEQTTGIEQVNQALSQMDQVTQQNAALVEQAAAAAQAMSEQATELRSAVGIFKTAGGIAHPAPVARAAVVVKTAPKPAPAAARSLPAKVPPRANKPAPAPSSSFKKEEADGDWETF